MRILKSETHIDFLRYRKLGFLISSVVIIVSLGALFLRGLNFGIDFTGGTLVEVGYDQAVDVQEVRNTMGAAGFDKALVQRFGSTQDVLIRMPVDVETSSAEQSSQIMQALRDQAGEELAGGLEGQGGVQQCAREGTTQDCAVQMRRVEFVGPQVGEELTNQGGMAMIYALIGILIYVAIRFRWQFSIGGVAALAHDVVVTIGMFALFQFEFSLPVLAAVLAVIGYSLNDTIVVFDRIRENFPKMRTSDPVKIMNGSINQTLPRTILTSGTTLLVVLSLLIFGGEVIKGFAIALLIGVIVGTYSSIFVASPTVLALGIQREHMMPPETNDDNDMKAVV